MTARIGSGETPFELVEDGGTSASVYRGQERRRARPRITVSDRLGEARRGTWIIGLTRSILVLAGWFALVWPRLLPEHPWLAYGAPALYLVAEGVGLGAVFRYLTRLARAASRY